jgi:hypothetical protein
MNLIVMLIEQSNLDQISPFFDQDPLIVPVFDTKLTLIRVLAKAFWIKLGTESISNIGDVQVNPSWLDNIHN